MRKIVRVMRKDIKKGVAGETKRCPIYYALKRAFPELDDIKVLGEDVSYYKPDKIHPTHQFLPVRAYKFLEYFDDHGVGKPFSFSISL